MHNFTRTIQYAILALLFFVASLSVAGFAYFYVDKEGNELASQMEIVNKNQQLQERYRSLEVLVEESSAEFAELESLLLTENNTIDFLSEIETIAGSMGLELSTDALKVDALPNPKYQTISLQLRAAGGHDQVIDFLEILETLPYYSRIEALEFREENRSTERWLAAVTLMVGLHAYDQ